MAVAVAFSKAANALTAIMAGATSGSGGEFDMLVSIVRKPLTGELFRLAGAL